MEKNEGKQTDNYIYGKNMTQPVPARTLKCGVCHCHSSIYQQGAVYYMEFYMPICSLSMYHIIAFQPISCNYYSRAIEYNML